MPAALLPGPGPGYRLGEKDTDADGRDPTQGHRPQRSQATGPTVFEAHDSPCSRRTPQTMPPSLAGFTAHVYIVCARGSKPLLTFRGHFVTLPRITSDQASQPHTLVENAECCDPGTWNSFNCSDQGDQASSNVEPPGVRLN
jgi:hypothetical protein